MENTLNYKLSVNSRKEKLLLLLLKGLHFFSIVFIVQLFKLLEHYLTTGLFSVISLIYLITLGYMLQIILQKDKGYILFGLMSMILNFFFIMVFKSMFM